MKNNKNQYIWPLADNDFSYLDRLKIAWFFLNKENRWTQDKYVRQFEEKIAEYVGVKYAVYVSSGSTANQLIAQEIKDRLIKSGEWKAGRKKVVFGAVTWQTNCSVWIREGFDPVFLDINLKDFSMDLNALNQLLEKKADKIAAVFPTSVLGYTPNIRLMNSLASLYGVEFALDNCENFFGFLNSGHGGKANINSFFTSSTSGYLAHQINSGGESGVIFTNDADKYEYFLMARAHALTRNIKAYRDKLDEAFTYDYKIPSNPLVDSDFDFHFLSSNYRNTDISAFCSLLDSEKWTKRKEHRIIMYNLFKNNLNREKYFLPETRLQTYDVAFCLPIIVQANKQGVNNQNIRKILSEFGIESRSFISGNMLRQTPYQKYGKYKNYPNAELINNNGLYVGINSYTNELDILRLCSILNNIEIDVLK